LETAALVGVRPLGGCGVSGPDYKAGAGGRQYAVGRAFGGAYREARGRATGSQNQPPPGPHVFASSSAAA
jgi:hypothetical protein